MAHSLRSNEHRVIGFPSLLPQNVLPTRGDVLKRILLSRDTQEQLQGKTCNNIPWTDIIQPVVQDLVDSWKKASIPTITEKSIEKAVNGLWQECKKGMKNDSSMKQVQDKTCWLLDICSCKCKQLACAQVHCDSSECEKVHMECKCEPSKRVPARELDFLFDQRGPRKMVMTGIDLKVTQTLKKAEKRAAAFEAQKEKEEKRLRSEAEIQKKVNEDFFAEDEGDAENEGDAEEDLKSDKTWEQEEPTKLDQLPKRRNMQPIPKTGEACDRWGVGSEAAADIINTYLMELGTLTPENMATMTVDKSKLNRWRKSGREKLQKKENEEMESKPVSSLYFDGKKDATLTRVKKGEKFYNKTVIEDHYVILEEPGSAYLGHEVPDSGHGISLGLTMFRFAKAKGWAPTMKVAGVDGCNVNVGNKEGALVYLEKLLGRPLQWFICMLHGVELPLRALVRELDGGTTSPTSLGGPIGSTLEEELTELEVVDFKKIPNPDFPVLEESVVHDLSKDQKYTYEAGHAIIQGHFPPDLANRDTGPLGGARWGTLGNRLMRKYVSTKRPSQKFQEIMEGIVLFWAPSWFTIKCNTKCTDGPKNLFKMVEFSRKLKKSSQTIVQKVMQRNGYFAHPEALLLAMLADSDENIRVQAVDTILEIRSKANFESQTSSGEEEVEHGVDEEDDDDEVEEGEEDDAFVLEPAERKAILNAKIRKYVVPKINFQATSYTQLIDWKNPGITEPPLTLSMTDAELIAFKTTPFDVPHYPCHTQAVERGVRLVSEASSQVIGQKARDGFIRQRIHARKELKKFATKKDFYPKVEAYADKC